MNRLAVVAVALLAVVGAVSAQDWRRDDENDIQYNCELVNALKEAAGAEGLMRTEAASSRAWLDSLIISSAVLAAGQSPPRGTD